MALNTSRKAFLAAVVCMAMYCIPLHAQSNNPYFKVTVVDLGVLPKDNKVGIATFKLVNNTKKTVSISSTKVSCGCTSLDYSKEPVSPGASTMLRATIKTEYKHGKFEEYILVRLSPDNYPCILRVKGIKKYGTQ